MQPNLSVFKEPRGIIRVIQVIFSILAFSSTIFFDTESSLRVDCSPFMHGSQGYKEIITFPVKYPFNMAENLIMAKFNCSKDMPWLPQRFTLDFSSSGQFYVVTGVLSLLFSGGALGVYTAMNTVYSSNPLLPILDMVGTGVLTTFWLAGSWAWTFAVSDIKYYTNPMYLRNHVFICKDPTALCSTLTLGKWSTLNISVVLGFANLFIWGTSMWFVFKETKYHSSGQPPAKAYRGSPGGDPEFPQERQQVY